MLTDFLNVIDRLIQLVKQRELTRRQLFQDHLEPMFLDMAKIHTDYLKSFGELLSEYRQLPHRPSFYTKLLAERKAELEAMRAKVYALTKAYADDSLRPFPEEAESFFRLCRDYVQTASGEVQMYGGRYSDLLSYMEAERIRSEHPPLEAVPNLDPDRGYKVNLGEGDESGGDSTFWMRIEAGVPFQNREGEPFGPDEQTFGGTLYAMLEDVKRRWSEITTSYAIARTSMLV